mmetsp:Transcript_70055/g.135237  ORF Transcript_70055/g.135237 Transcript_70055/m.135237 type:complete len:347 (-) Transcript_70055:12-1052(-)
MNKHGSRGDNLGRGRVRSEDTKGVKDLAYKLAGDFRDSKLEGATIIVDRLERLKDLAVDGQVEQMRQLKDVMKNWREILNSVPDETDELATGDMAVCSSWYAPKVQVKLKDLFEEFKDTEKAFAQIKPDKFQDLGRRMNKAMEKIAPAVYGMQNLPNEVSDVADRADEREETLKDTDTKAMKKLLEGQGMTISLSSLEDCKRGLLDLVEPTQRNLEKVQTFVSEAHDKFKQAFEVPCPCCCMTSYVYDQPSRCLTELLENADRALDVDLQPFFELLRGLKDDYSDLDLNRVSKPTNRFAALATERVDRLDKIVAGARPSRISPCCFRPLSVTSPERSDPASLKLQA